jgi:ketosteroid isomerase-like protein
METPVVTRMSTKGPVPKERNFTDRMTVRFPRSARWALAMGMRALSPRSRIRRDGLKRVLRSGWAAAPRRDWELMLARYSPEVVWDLPEEFQTLGFAESYRGHDGLRAGIEQFSEAFESWEIRPEKAMDFGDRVLALGSFRGKARASGVVWEQPFSQLVTVERGLVTRDRFFYSWDQGFEAAGVDPDAL